MSFRSMDSQQMLLWAAVAFAVYWIFFKNKQEFYAEHSVPQEYAQVPQYHQQIAQEEANILNVTPPVPEEIPQYAPAYTM